MFAYFAPLNSTFFRQIYLVLLLLLLPSVTSAASLVVSPRTGTFEAGSTFPVAIIVDASDAAFNAVSGRLAYPADMLEVTSISKSQSVISLWVQEPAFSNAAGSVSFEGIVLNPGYKGSNGKVITVQFRAKKTGSAAVSFSTAEVLANDGIGTNILSSMGRGNYTLIAKVVAPVTEVETPDTDETPPATDSYVLGPAPKVGSVTHPENGWSAQTTGVFNFGIEAGVVAMRLLTDDKSDSVPTVVYQPPVTERTIEGLIEGLSYLHVQLKDANGWGEKTHYKLQIDTAKPEQVKITETKDENGSLAFSLGALDQASGIDRYEIRINGGEVITVTPTLGETRFAPKGLVAGVHSIEIKAFDKAGNFELTSLQFVVADTEIKSGLWPWTLNAVGFGRFMVVVLSILIPIIALLGLLGALLLHLWSKTKRFNSGMKEAVLEARRKAAKSILCLRNDAEEDVALLEKASKKRVLTKEEAKILKRARTNLSETEEYIEEYFIDGVTAEALPESD